MAGREMFPSYHFVSGNQGVRLLPFAVFDCVCSEIGRGARPGPDYGTEICDGPRSAETHRLTHDYTDV